MIRRSAANEWRRKKEKKLRGEKKKYEMQVKAEKIRERKIPTAEERIARARRYIFCVG